MAFFNFLYERTHDYFRPELEPEITFQNPDEISLVFFQQGGHGWRIKTGLIYGILLSCTAVALAALTLVSLGIAGGLSPSFLASKRIIALYLGVSGGAALLISLGTLYFSFKRFYHEHDTVGFGCPWTISLRVNRHSIEEDPKPIWDSFIRALRERNSINSREGDLCRVQYLGENGIDAGALRRDFFCSLFAALLRTNRLCDQIVDGDQGRIPYLLPEDRGNESLFTLYEEVGEVMACIASDRNIVIGSQFDPLVFEVIHLEGMNTQSFENLTFAQKAQVYEILITHRINRARYVGRVEEIERNQKELEQLHACLSDQIPCTEKVEEYAQHLIDVIFCDREDLSNEEGNLDWNRIKEELIGLFEGDYVGYAKPLWTIAKGFRRAMRNLEGLSATGLSERVQGVLDRNAIAAHLFLHTNVPRYNRYVGWLREWILRGARDPELERFLMFVTGATRLLPSASITIEFQEGRNFLFQAVACSQRLSIHLGEEDLSQEAFIQGLVRTCVGTNAFNVM